MKQKLMLAVCLIVAAGAVAAGCGGGSSVTGTAAAPRVVALVPADNASGVATSTVVTVTFSTPMNAGSVQNNFHMYKNDAATGTAIVGVCTWNGDGTVMTFHPGQNLDASATHTMHFGDGMTGNMGGMMRDMMGTAMMAGGSAMRFRTQ